MKVPSLSRKSGVRHGPSAPSLDLPHVPGVSWRPQPARTATRRPGRTSDGRKGHEGRAQLRPGRTSDGRKGPKHGPGRCDVGV